MRGKKTLWHYLNPNDDSFPNQLVFEPNQLVLYLTLKQLALCLATNIFVFVPNQLIFWGNQFIFVLNSNQVVFVPNPNQLVFWPKPNKFMHRKQTTHLLYCRYPLSHLYGLIIPHKRLLKGVITSELDWSNLKYSLQTNATINLSNANLCALTSLTGMWQAGPHSLWGTQWNTIWDTKYQGG